MAFAVVIFAIFLILSLLPVLRFLGYGLVLLGIRLLHLSDQEKKKASRSYAGVRRKSGKH